jgi:hypothetical protein
MTRDLASRRNRAATLQQRRPAAAAPEPLSLVTVEWHGERYPAVSYADGAAWELLSALPRPDFVPNPRPGSDYPHRWFVHASEVSRDGVPLAVEDDRAMTVPLAPGLDLGYIRRLTQTPHLEPGARVLLNRVRSSSPLVPGETMERALTVAQAVRLMETAAVPGGFCYRRRDIAHLRTPAGRCALGGETEPGDQVVLALRWEVADPGQYHAPVAPDYEGLSTMPSSERRGAPVLGTGFALSTTHLIPEYVTVDLADLPLPEGARLIAFTADGSETELFGYIERQWRPLADIDRRRSLAHLLNGLDLSASVPVRRVLRDVTRVDWKGVPGSLVDGDEDWGRFRLSRPGPDVVARTGAEPVGRGVYEKWVPHGELASR